MSTGNKGFYGSIVALVTPMNADGSIDYESLKSLVEWHVDSGTHGIVVMGTTGEASLVSSEELIDCIRAVKDFAGTRIKVIAGCGAASTQSTLENVQRVNALNVDGFLCVTPYYVRPTQTGLIQHFEAIAERCNAPLILYNVPSRTGCDLKNESVITLSLHENIVGIKDAVGDVSRAKELFDALTDEFIFLSGDDETAFDYVKSGGDGVISVTSNIAPLEMAKWNELIIKSRNQNENIASTEVAQNLLDAERIFSQLMPLHRNLFVESNPIPAKWALYLMNRIKSGIRLPLTEPSAQSKKLISDALESAIGFSRPSTGV